MVIEPAVSGERCDPTPVSRDRPDPPVTGKDLPSGFEMLFGTDELELLEVKGGSVSPASGAYRGWRLQT
jgi:hypothetical protein